MTRPIPGWTQIAAAPLVLLREYSFGPATANSLAVGLPDGSLLLISAPTDLSESDLNALASSAPVSALLANNGAHHMGLGRLSKRFPRAVCYATPAAAERIVKKNRDRVTIQPVAQLSAKLGDQIEIVAADGCKVGDVIVRIHSDRGTIIYMGDFFANIPKLPWNPLSRLMFKLTDSGPGFKVFGIFFRFFTSDRRALRDFLIREIEAKPPVILVPGHGDPIVRNDLAPTMVSMLRAAIKA